MRSARAHGAVVIGDVIPGHTGKGADFLLAERAYGDYPGLYHMVRIEPSDWALLPPVPAGHDSVNLSPSIVDALQARHYIVGMLSSRIFYQPGIKDSDWSATDVVRGADGIEPSLGVPALLQGRPANVELARPYFRGAEARDR